jgi:hypothetical protein
VYYADYIAPSDTAAVARYLRQSKEDDGLVLDPRTFALEPGPHSWEGHRSFPWMAVGSLSNRANGEILSSFSYARDWMLDTVLRWISSISIRNVKRGAKIVLHGLLTGMRAFFRMAVRMMSVSYHTASDALPVIREFVSSVLVALLKRVDTQVPCFVRARDLVISWALEDEGTELKDDLLLEEDIDCPAEHRPRRRERSTSPYRSDTDSDSGVDSGVGFYQMTPRKK